MIGDDDVLDSYSINSATVPTLPLDELLVSARRYGFPAIGLWRTLLADVSAAQAARMVRNAGLRVSTLCRAGLFTDADPVRRRDAVTDSLLAVQQAAELEAASLVVVPGGLVGRDLVGSRHMVRDALGEVAAAADDAGVRLSVEPMHPMLVQARSVITSLREALDLINALGNSSLGIAYDSYHLWWDAELVTQTARARGRLLAVQLADWLPPTANLTACRGLPGEGCVDFAAFLALAHSAGYRGDVEIEVISERWEKAGAGPTLRALVAGLHLDATVDS